ncbi:MAG TPA: antibiotic biosynthesis monooxygenase [Roseovarius sp.]|nr:antibiotic biosynthesis monooxygenase [Roseovarius sp.]
MSHAVVRRWEAMVARADIAGWKETFRARVLPSMQGAEGFVGISVHAARDGDPCRMTVLTSWDSLDAIRGFAGDTPENAVIPDFMMPYFREHDAQATFHDEILREGSK